jgi:hypothetical protein
MTPLAFLKNYEDTLRNGQITTLVEALFSCPDHAMAEDKYQRWLLQNFNLAIDQIDFLVPFERIDEFMTLWSAQTGRWVPQAHQILNEAPPDNVDIHAIRNVIQELPQLYSLDVELWRVAQSWFSSYREKVLSRFTRTTEPQNSSVAFFDESNRNAVLLTRGWYPPLCHSNGRKEWWAGPQRASEIEVRRNFHSGRLTFEITVVIGIDLKDVIFLSKNTGKRLNVEMAAMNEGTTSVHVDIGELGEDDPIVVVVPKVYSPIQIHEHDNDPTRRSFAATGWCLTDGRDLDVFTEIRDGDWRLPAGSLAPSR